MQSGRTAHLSPLSVQNNIHILVQLTYDELGHAGWDKGGFVCGKLKHGRFERQTRMRQTGIRPIWRYFSRSCVCMGSYKVWFSMISLLKRFTKIQEIYEYAPAPVCISRYPPQKCNAMICGCLLQWRQYTGTCIFRTKRVCWEKERTNFCMTT